MNLRASLPAGTRRGVPAPDPVASDEALPGRVEVAIVGGGIVGAAAAFFLARRGIRVLLCEKGSVGGEQSGRNWGWVRQMGRDAAELPLAVESLRLWRGLRALGVETGFEETGIAYLARGPRDREAFAVWEAQGRAHGVPVRIVGGAALAGLVPGLHDVHDVALHTATDGRAEPGLAAPALAEAARRHGAAIATGCAVRGVETSAGRVSGIVTEHGRVGCDAVLVAAGAWSRLFLGNHGVRFPQLRVHETAARIETAAALPAMPLGAGFAVRRRRDGGYTLARRGSSLVPIVPDSFVLLADFLPTYVRTWRELKLRVTAESLAELRAPRRWALDAASPFEAARMLDPDPDPADVRGALQGLRRAFPEAVDARVTHAWGGVIDATPDAVPAIGPIPGRPGLFLASGFSGHGFGLGPGAGRLAADLVTGEPPCADAAPFSPARFMPAATRGD